tara:strand:+ start:3998 stop:4516 length:519 start_codon:yes stop_codon:yes gene_type:complete
MQEKIVKPPLSLVNKILKIMEDIDYIQKDGTNSFHGYNFATDMNLLSTYRKKFIEYGMVVVPSVNKVVIDGTITNIDMGIALICCETGEKIEVPWAGQGQDKGDKGLYKAMTGGLKYWLMKTFMLPTGDDPEIDTRKPKAKSKTSAGLEKEKQALKSTRQKPIKAQPVEDIL